MKEQYTEARKESTQYRALYHGLLDGQGQKTRKRKAKAAVRAMEGIKNEE